MDYDPLKGNFVEFERLENQDLEHKIAAALNRFSAENASNTPDFLLARFLLGCLAAWNQTINQRERWYGREAGPCSQPDTAPAKGADTVGSSLTDPGSACGEANGHHI